MSAQHFSPVAAISPRAGHRQRDSASKVVGVIGGMGPLATHAFYGAVIAVTRASVDQDHLHVIIDSNAKIPDRTAFLLGKGEDPRNGLIASGQRLAAVGAQLLVIPCNTANIFAEEVAAATGLQVVDWVGAVVEELIALGTECAGILATTGTVVSEIYQRALDGAGIRWILPSKDQQTVLMTTIYGPEGVKSGGLSDSTRRSLVEIGKHLLGGGADTLLLGCTELPLALPSTDGRWPVRTIDPSVVVARRVVLDAGAAIVEAAP